MKWESLGDITLLITDDDAFNRQLVISLLAKIPTIRFFEAEDGVEALAILEKKPIDMILLDLHMPKMDGYETLKVIKKESKYDLIPTAIITTDEEEMKKLYLLGADDFISKPFDLKELESRIYTHIEKKKYQKKQHQHTLPKSQNSVIEVQEKIIKGSSSRTKITKKYKDIYALEEIELSQKETFHLMAKMFYKKENRLKQQERVAVLAKALSLLIGYDKKIAETIYYATFIKDIGTIFTEKSESHKDSIISGYQLLNSSIETEFIQISKKIMTQHKEHYDGTGFPQQLKGKEIYILAYIVAMVEGFDLLLTHKKYLNHEAKSVDEVYNFFKLKGTHYFHPKITQLFLEHFNYFIELREKIIEQNL